MATQIMKHRGQAAGLLGVVAFFSAVWAAFLTRSVSDPYVLVPFVLAVAGIGLYVATNLGELGEQLTGRGSFYGVLSAVFAVLVVGALIGVNYIAARRPKQWDLTKDKVYTLSEQTQGTLKSLKDEVKIRAFFSALEPEAQELEARVRQYKGFTDKLVLELLDPNKHLDEVKKANVTSGTPRILVKHGAKEARAKDASEESLTNAIAEVTRGGAKKIYFTKGHGEHGPTEGGERGLKLFVDNLKGEGFQTDEANLMTAKAIPADAQAIVVAGPAAAFLEPEAKLLQEWVEKGGKLVALVDPSVQSGLEKTFASWGIAIGDDTVIDPESQQPEVAIAQQYADHPITKARTSATALPVVLPLARSVSKAKAPPAGWNVVELAKTGPTAWGETELRRDAPVKYDAGKDTPGPVSLAIAATKGSGDTESRVVVIGNSGFAANATYRFLGNRDFALNALGWAAKDEAKISIRPTRRQGNLLFLSAEQKKGMFLFALNVLPFALLAAGLLVWQTRKSR